MARKASTKTVAIDPVAVTAAALKAVKVAADYHRLGSTTEPAVLEAAWDKLPEPEKQRITQIVNNNTAPTPNAIALELSSCGSKIQLESVKAEYGELAVKAAWKLLSPDERDRLTSICLPGQQATEEPQPVTEQPTIYKVELQPQPKKNTLIELTADLQQLDNMLDMIDGDIPVELQQIVDTLLAQRDATQEQLLEKLDNYCGLIQSRLMWAAARKAEGERMMKLAESDFKTVDFLRGRLKEHLEATDQKKLRTKRFNISICQNGGKAPLRFDDTTPEQMPERFQRVTVEPNRDAIRTALEQGEELQFA